MFGGGTLEFSFGLAESLALTWYLNKVSLLNEVIKGVRADRERRGLRTLPRDPPASRGEREKRGISKRD